MMGAKVIGARTRTLALLFLVSCTIGSEGSRNMLQTSPPPVSGGSTAAGTPPTVPSGGIGGTTTTTSNTQSAGGGGGATSAAAVTASPSPPPTTVTAAAVTPPPTTVVAGTPPPPTTVVAGTPPPPTTVVAGTPPPPTTVVAGTPPPLATARTPPPPSGQCGTSKSYTFTFADYTCPNGGACGTGRYSNTSSPQSTQTFTDTLGGKFSTLTATLTGQSRRDGYSSNSQFQQELYINGKSFGRFPALGLGSNVVIDCSNTCSTQGLSKGTQTGYVVGGTNTFSLPATNYLNYVYSQTGEKIYTYYFTAMTITVTTTC